jgi:hypothetical protein
MRNADEVELLDEPPTLLLEPLDLTELAVFLLELETLWMGVAMTFGPTLKGALEGPAAPAPGVEYSQSPNRSGATPFVTLSLTRTSLSSDIPQSTDPEEI